MIRLFRRNDELMMLRQAVVDAQAERAALLRTIDEAQQARRDAEKILSDAMFSFMLKVQQIRREARMAVEEARVH